MPDQYFVSDTHFNHANILKFSPWRAEQLEKLGLPLTIESHDTYIKQQWNKTVHKNDLVYFLGDLGIFRRPKDFLSCLSELNGQKVFFKGNHDFTSELKKALNRPETGVIEFVDGAKVIKIDGIKLWLSHYAALLPNPYVSVHGHIHESDYTSGLFKTLNLSLDSPFNRQREFGKPVSLNEVVTEAKQLVLDRQAFIKRGQFNNHTLEIISPEGKILK